MADPHANAASPVASHRRHKHEFTGLWWHYGRYGDQGVHLHSCFEEDCDTVLIATSRDCEGKHQAHRRTTLDAELQKRGKANG